MRAGRQNPMPEEDDLLRDGHQNQYEMIVYTKIVCKHRNIHICPELFLHVFGLQVREAHLFQLTRTIRFALTNPDRKRPSPVEML